MGQVIDILETVELSGRVCDACHRATWISNHHQALADLLVGLYDFDDGVPIDVIRISMSRGSSVKTLRNHASYT